MQAPSIRQFLLTNLVRSSNGDFLRFRIPIKTLGLSLDYMGDFPFKDPDEVRYDGPTLFIRGAQSHYVADDVLPLIGRFFPRFEVKDIDCGHWVISEKPAEFKDGTSPILNGEFMLTGLAVVDFVQRIDAQSD